MSYTILTNVGYNVISNAIATSSQVTPKYFKVSYENATPDSTWTDIPSPVLTKDISGFLKVNDRQFSLFCNILNTEVSNPITLLGIYDNNDNLLFVTKFDPPATIRANTYLETRFTLDNYEEVINFNEIPFDEVEQTNLILEILYKYYTLIQDIACINLDIKDLQLQLANITNGDYNLNDAINAHNLNEAAHPPLQKAMAKAGIFVKPEDIEYVGQFWDEFAVFDSSVSEDMVVYKNTDGKYYPAIADGTLRAVPAGIAKIGYGRVVSSGFIDISNQPNVSSFNIGDKLYLSDSQPGVLITDETAVMVGYYLGNNLALIGVGVGTGGKGEVTFEDLTYVLLLHSNPYRQIYYDILDKASTLTITSGSADYISKDTLWKTTSNNTTFITTDNVINDGNTYYRFLVHVEASNTVNVSYSIDNGSTWTSINTDETIVVSSGFTQLKLKFDIPNNNTELYSYGILYDYSFDSYVPDTRMFEVLNVTSNQQAPIDITLPNNATYTPNGKDLEVYLNRLRLIPNIDYDEIDSRTIRLKIDLQEGDILVFTEKWGVVDNSIENQQKLNALAPSWTDNTANYIVLRDQNDGTPYKVYIQGGSLQIQPL